MRSRLGFAALGLALGFTHYAHAYDVEIIQQGGSAANRLDLVVLGDGYRTEDQAQLTSDTQTLLERFWGQEIFSSYRSYLNIRIIHVISQDRGADNGTYGAMVTTTLNTNFGCGGVDRLLCVDEAKALEVATTDTPDFDQLLVLVNDPKYGGSGGTVATSSINSEAGDVVVHEIGHSLFGLADEYDTATPGFERCMGDCPEPNATTLTDRASIKWGHWIDPGTTLPTPDQGQDNSVVGAFEGCRYFTDGQYRPVSNCIMRALGGQYCPVCSEVAVLNFYDKVSPIDSLVPAAAVQVQLSDSVSFEVLGPRPDPNTLLFSWSTESAVVLAEDASGVLAVTGSTLGVGVHSLKVDIRDTTTLVRKDPDALLTEHAEWQVTVVDASGGAGGSAGVGGSAGLGGSAGTASGGSSGNAAGGSGGSGGGSGAGGTAGSGTAGSGGSGGSSAGTGGSAGSAGSGSGATAGAGNSAPAPEQESGCWCSSVASGQAAEGRPGRGGLWFSALVAALALRRRRLPRRA